MLQRSNPLPVGEYWIDVIGDEHQTMFAAWSFEHSPSLNIVATETFESVGFPECNEWDFTIDSMCAPSRAWVKFKVLAPVEWDARTFGFPNIIAEGEVIESSTDTFTQPDFGDYCDIGCQAEKVAVAAGVVLGGVALVLILAKVT